VPEPLADRAERVNRRARSENGPVQGLDAQSRWTNGLVSTVEAFGPIRDAVRTERIYRSTKPISDRADRVNRSTQTDFGSG